MDIRRRTQVPEEDNFRADIDCDGEEREWRTTDQMDVMFAPKVRKEDVVQGMERSSPLHVHEKDWS